MKYSDLLKSIINSKGSVDVAVAGASMSPSITPDDMVRLESVKEGPLVGSIVSYPGPRSSYPVLHRVVEVSRSGFFAVGDNSCSLAESPLERIIGKVSGIRINKKWLAVADRNPWAEVIARLSFDITCNGDDTKAPGCATESPASIIELLEARQNACMEWRNAIQMQADQP